MREAGAESGRGWSREWESLEQRVGEAGAESERGWSREWERLEQRVREEREIEKMKRGRKRERDR